MVNGGITVFIGLRFVAYEKHVTYTGSVVLLVLFGMLVNLLFYKIVIEILKEINVRSLGSFDIVVSKK